MTPCCRSRVRLHGRQRGHGLFPRSAAVALPLQRELRALCGAAAALRSPFCRSSRACGCSREDGVPSLLYRRPAVSVISSIPLSFSGSRRLRVRIAALGIACGDARLAGMGVLGERSRCGAGAVRECTCPAVTRALRKRHGVSVSSCSPLAHYVPVSLSGRGEPHPPRILR